MILFDIDEAFFRDHWRRSPAVFRGAARHLITQAPSPLLLAELQKHPGIRCSTDGKAVWFFQQLVHELPLIERLTAAGRELFEWEHVTCDLVHTRGPASIGCHFDEDDNFSMQLVGAKRWRLSSPEPLPLDIVRRRMLKEPDVGSAVLGSDVMELTIEAGDVLYIPQTWIHWGESIDDSMSITLTVNSRTYHLGFAGSLADALRRVPEWTRSVPTGPGSRAERERALDALVRETFTADAAERMRPFVAPRTVVSSLTMDMDRVRAFMAAVPAVPTSGFVLPEEGVGTHRVLRELLARRTLRRLLATVAKRFESTRGSPDRVLFQQCIDGMLARPDAELARLCTEPEMVSLATIAKDGESRHEDPIAPELARALVPEFQLSAADTVAFPLLPDLDGGFSLRRAGVRIVPEQPRSDLVVRVIGGTLQVFADGRFREPDDAPGLHVKLLPRLLGEGPHLSPAPTTWVARNVRGQEVSAADTAAFAEFCEAMQSGAETLASVWPAAWREVADGVRWMLPLSDQGQKPFNYSVHAFRGLIASSPRRDHRCAQTLVHEGGHNRLSTILDLFDLCADPGELVISPVVTAARPMSFVFHGCFAFAQDVAFTTRLLQVAPQSERASLARYLDEVHHKATAALKLLQRRAKTTPTGATILNELARTVGQ